jgi:hypothetical protein
MEKATTPAIWAGDITPRSLSGTTPFFIGAGTSIGNRKTILSQIPPHDFTFLIIAIIPSAISRFRSCRLIYQTKIDRYQFHLENNDD